MVKSSLAYHNCILQPGYLVFSQEPAFLCSVCGNGVVVTVWDRVKRIGGMAHCIFPGRGLRDRPSNYYADVAIPQLVRSLISQHSLQDNLEAQLFGGGSVRGCAARRARNLVEAIRRILRRHRVLIVSEDIGGSVGRKIVFDTRSGDIMVVKTKRVRKTDWAPEYLIGTHGQNKSSDR